MLHDQFNARSRHAAAWPELPQATQQCHATSSVVDAMDALPSAGVGPVDVLGIIDGPAQQPVPPVDVLQLVCEKDPIFQRRSRPLLQHARSSKHIRSLKARFASSGQFPAHTLEQIERHNAKLAVRMPDTITWAARRPKVKGKGRHKQWLATAVLRLCYGRGWTPQAPPRRLRVKQYWKQRHLPKKRRTHSA